MAGMMLREMTADDIVGMVASLSGWHVGDYIQPLVGDGKNRGRKCLRVIRRMEFAVPGGMSVRYIGIDKHGTPSDDIWIADDPRACTEAAFNAESDDE